MGEQINYMNMYIMVDYESVLYFTFLRRILIHSLKNKQVISQYKKANWCKFLKKIWLTAHDEIIN